MHAFEGSRIKIWIQREILGKVKVGITIRLENLQSFPLNGVKFHAEFIFSC